ncbi:uncharacterized protein LOC120644745 isoform X2 [Panicum virgatum]|uniref:uncharacterized protein LOC120644745 isoform X2 n=1 Tax=Panicum virgatum TaxID=38727 RepID=UPI0019D62231|nr:uncharacterized protein LOC120644745 isoform X2 [Panicum virgatum]
MFCRSWIGEGPSRTRLSSRPPVGAVPRWRRAAFVHKRALPLPLEQLARTSSPIGACPCGFEAECRCRCGHGFGDLGRGTPFAAVFLGLSSTISTISSCVWQAIFLGSSSNDSWTRLWLLLQMHLVAPLQRHGKALQRKGPVHPLTRKLLRRYLLVKKLQIAVVAVMVVQPPLIRTVQADA